MTGGGSRVGESVDYDRWWIKGTYGVGESLECQYTNLIWEREEGIHALCCSLLDFLKI